MVYIFREIDDIYNERLKNAKRKKLKKAIIKLKKRFERKL